MVGCWVQYTDQNCIAQKWWVSSAPVSFRWCCCRQRENSLSHKLSGYRWSLYRLVLVDVLGWLTRWWLVGRHANAVSNGVAPNASGPNCACHHVFALILHILHAFKFLGNVLLQIFEHTRVAWALWIRTGANKTRGQGLFGFLWHGDGCGATTHKQERWHNLWEPEQ